MKKILIIDTGGTFNKVYNPITGCLDIETKSMAVDTIAQHWVVEFEVLSCVGRDSLDMTQSDRGEILKAIKSSKLKSIIIIHGTDTIDKTAQYLANAKIDKEIIVTGAMVPFSINPIEATANFASAYGYLQNLNKNGIYIALNGTIDAYDRVKKNREKGKFEGTMVYKNKF